MIALTNITRRNSVNNLEPIYLCPLSVMAFDIVLIFLSTFKHFPTNHNVRHYLKSGTKLSTEEGDCLFYSLSMNSSGDGGSGLSPFLFLTSATSVLNIEFGTGCQALK